MSRIFNLSLPLKWVPLVGASLFTFMMATGYYYNLTFVQLGLKDLGERLLEMEQATVALYMALLALLTCLVALGTGYLMKVRGWSRDFYFKLRLAFFVILLQTLLTAIAPGLRSAGAFLAWIIVASSALGLGVPAMFSMTVDLVPRRYRGHVGAAVTGLAYFAAELASGQWVIEDFSRGVLWLMAAGAIGMGFLAFTRPPLIAQFANQHKLPAFGRGRFVQIDAHGQTHIKRRLYIIIILMFGIFFIDSLGFLRLLDTPVYMETAWQSPQLGIRLFIGIVHVIAALIGGILYTQLDEKTLFLWIFGIFTLVHFSYGIDARWGGNAPLGMPMLYAIAVSLYTVVNFAIWADVSTPSDISFKTSLGVALSGWTATFLSTALAIQWMGAGMGLEDHLRIVNAFSLLFFILMLFILIFPDAGQKRSQRGAYPEQVA
jgi:MFS family permease